MRTGVGSCLVAGRAADRDGDPFRHQCHERRRKRAAGLTRQAGGLENSPSWSPDGRKIAFTAARDSALVIDVVNVDGSGRRLLARNIPGSFTPAWSPDGRKIAYVGWGSDEGKFEQRLTRNPGRDSNPAWSTDGRSIAFESTSQVYVMNADGSGQRRLTNNGGRNFAPGWSPDGGRRTDPPRLSRSEVTKLGRLDLQATQQLRRRPDRPKEPDRVP